MRSFLALVLLLMATHCLGQPINTSISRDHFTFGNRIIQGQDAGIRLYPNPATAALFVHFNSAPSAGAEVSIYNALGQRLLRQPLAVGEKQLRFDIGELPAGAYWLVVRRGELVKSRPWVKQ